MTLAEAFAAALAIVDAAMYRPAMTHTIEHRADGTCVLLDERGLVLLAGTYSECQDEIERRYRREDADYC